MSSLCDVHHCTQSLWSTCQWPIDSSSTAMEIILVQMVCWLTVRCCHSQMFSSNGSVAPQTDISSWLHRAIDLMNVVAVSRHSELSTMRELFSPAACLKSF